MNYQVQDHGGIAELIIEGNVLQENVDSLRSRLNELIEHKKVRVILNMAHAGYVSSLCLAVIVDVKTRLSGENGDLKIANVNKLIRNLLEITNLVKKIELFDTVEEAIVAFKSDETK